MTYSVTIAPVAERQLHKFDPQVRRRVQAAIELLAANPRPPKAIQLVGGAGEWRVRTGAYRIIYEIHDDHLIVLVLRVGYRRDISEYREPDRIRAES
jgi:mRNA interferase RelE/StbE